MLDRAGASTSMDRSAEQPGYDEPSVPTNKKTSPQNPDGEEEISIEDIPF